MNIRPFENKIWLSSPTMHGEELTYVTEAIETNGVSTVGANKDRNRQLRGNDPDQFQGRRGKGTKVEYPVQRSGPLVPA